VLHETLKTQVEEAMATLSEEPDEFYRAVLNQGR
jgi:hypothetical protein